MGDFELIQHVFSRLRDSVGTLKPSLYRINKNRKCVVCSKFDLSLSTNTFKDFLCDISNKYENLGEEFEGLVEYNGQDFENRLSWVELSSLYVSTVWQSITVAKKYFERGWVANLKDDPTGDPKGFMIDGKVDQYDITLMMDTPPVKRLKHVLSLSDDKYKIVDGPLLVLPEKIDVLRVDNKIYFLTRKGRNIFRIQEERNAECEKTITKMLDVGVVDQNSDFSKFARKGHNPRRLMAYSEKEGQEKLLYLADKKKGKKIREAFGINLSGNKIAPKTMEETERLIKIITERGMLDPFSNGAMEVSGATVWDRGVK